MLLFFTGSCISYSSRSQLSLNVQPLYRKYLTPEQRGWGAGVGGLPFIGIGIGSIIGVACTPLTNRNYLSQMQKHANGKPVWPEARLPPTFIGAFLMPISLFWYCMPLN